ncbi:MAG: hypothetical protein IJ137_07020 [Eubacterium sp.]|nr:hypothetical protein [Eubacterium sp.]
MKNNILLFIGALKECLKKESFEKIPVSDIVETAGRSRQTFYRCCENKYDLVNKYLEGIIHDSYRQFDEDFSLHRTLLSKFRIMEPEKDLFSQAFQSHDYESLHRYTHRVIYRLYLNLAAKAGVDTFSEEEKMLLDMHCEESVYATVKWSCGDILCSPEEMAGLLMEAMPEKLKKIYARFL